MPSEHVEGQSASLIQLQIDVGMKEPFGHFVYFVLHLTETQSMTTDERRVRARTYEARSLVVRPQVRSHFLDYTDRSSSVLGKAFSSKCRYTSISNTEVQFIFEMGKYLTKSSSDKSLYSPLLSFS